MNGRSQAIERCWLIAKVVHDWNICQLAKYTVNSFSVVLSQKSSNIISLEHLTNLWYGSIPGILYVSFFFMKTTLSFKVNYSFAALYTPQELLKLWRIITPFAILWIKRCVILSQRITSSASSSRVSNEKRHGLLLRDLSINVEGFPASSTCRLWCFYMRLEVYRSKLWVILQFL